MKINSLLKFFLVIVILAGNAPSFASSSPVPTEIREADASRLNNRLAEIKAMDKTVLTSTEKKALRREVRAIKKELAASGGVYLSIGAILLIALLLILLL